MYIYFQNSTAVPVRRSVSDRRLSPTPRRWSAAPKNSSISRALSLGDLSSREGKDQWSHPSVLEDSADYDDSGFMDVEKLRKGQDALIVVVCILLRLHIQKCAGYQHSCKLRVSFSYI